MANGKGSSCRRDHVNATWNGLNRVAGIEPESESSGMQESGSGTRHLMQVRGVWVGRRKEEDNQKNPCASTGRRAPTFECGDSRL